MGEKKQFRLPMELPFYTQQMTPDNWELEQFSSFQKADSWTMRSCGIASLRMVLDGFGKNVERHGPMIEKGEAAGAYKEGVGWIHWGLAKLAAEYGIYGEALRGKTAEGLKRELDNGYPCIISIAPFFQGGKPKPDGSGVYGKSGHLIPIFGYETEDGALTAFLVHHPSAFAEKNKAHWWVPMEQFRSSFSGNYIRFRPKGRIRQAVPADAAEMSRIHAASWKKAFLGMVPQDYLDRLPENHWQAVFPKNLEDGSLSAKLIYEGDFPIGVITYGSARTELPVGGVPGEVFADYAAFGEVMSLYLLPEYYGRGYGRELLEVAREELLQTYEGVYLWVLRENEQARRFYEKLGFAPTEETCLCQIDGKTLTDIRYVYRKK